MSISEAQILQSLNIGRPRDTFTEATNDALGEVLQAWTDESVESARAILSEQGREASGSLSASIRGSIEFIPGIARITIFTDPAAEFVDQGVTGFGGHPEGIQYFSNSNFSFKTPFPNKKMAKAIRGWIPAKGVQLPGTIPTFEALSYAIATNVKKKGIEPSGFLSLTFNEESINNLGKALTMRLGEAYAVTFKRVFNGD